MDTQRFVHLFLIDQGFPVEYGLNTFNTSPPKLAMSIAMQNPASTPNSFHLWATFSGDTHASPGNNQSYKITATSTFISSNSKHDFCYIRQHISLARPTMPKNNYTFRPGISLQKYFLHTPITPFQFFTFFPSYEACSTNANSLFHAVIKNYH